VTAPQCARCGATTADRAYIGFTDDADQAETYCVLCLSPDQLKMVTDIAALKAINLQDGGT
jgi:hypothetical protein